MGILLLLKEKFPHLGCDVLVWYSDNESVFWSVVFVFILNDQTFSGIVVSLSFSAPLEFHLKSFEVSFILDYFNKRLRIKLRIKYFWDDDDDE